MNPSKLLSRFLKDGTRPSSQREASALLDESRSLLVNRLPTTGETIQNFTADELATVDLKGGSVLAEMHKIHLEKRNYTPSSAPSTMKLFPQTPKATAPPRRNPAAARPAAPAAPAATARPPVIHRATATATKTSAPSATITAAQFATPELRMDRENFSILSPADKSRFCKTGGKITNQ